MTTKAEVERTTVLKNWFAAKKALDAAKELENKLRLEAVELFFPTHKEEGTENVTLGDGYKLKGVFKLNYSLDNEDGKTEDALDKIEATSPEGAFLAERLVKWEPKLSVTEYRALPEWAKKIIDEVLTAKPGTPSLEIVAPKSK